MRARAVHFFYLETPTLACASVGVPGGQYALVKDDAMRRLRDGLQALVGRLVVPAALKPGSTPVEKPEQCCAPG